MQSSTESLQWYDPWLLLPGGPLSDNADGSARSGFTRRLSLPHQQQQEDGEHAEQEAQTLRRLAVQHAIHQSLVHETLSSAPTNSAHVQATLAALKFNHRPDGSAQGPSSRSGLGGRGNAGDTGLLADLMGGGRRASTTSEPSLLLFDHIDDPLGQTSTTRAQTAATATSSSPASTQQAFRDVPATLGVDVSAVLCPVVQDQETASRARQTGGSDARTGGPTPARLRVAASREIFATTTRTVPQRLLIFDQLDDIPISDVVLVGNPVLPGGAPILNHGEDSSSSSGEESGNTAAAAALARGRVLQAKHDTHAPVSAWPMGTTVAPCSMEEQDAVKTLVFDGTGRFLVVTFTSGKAVYLFIPRRPSPEELSDGECDDDAGANGEDEVASQDPTETEAEARLRRKQAHDEALKRKHKAWKASAVKWATLGLQRRREHSTESTRDKSGSDGSDNEEAAYRPTIFSLTCFCEERRQGSSGALVPLLVESVAWCTKGLCTPSHGAQRGSTSAVRGDSSTLFVSAELLLGARHGGLIVSCQLTSHLGAVRTRVVYAFPSPFSRRPIQSMACYVAPAAGVNVASGSDANTGDGKGGVNGEVLDGRRAEGQGTDAVRHTASPIGTFAPFAHTPHFMNVDGATTAATTTPWAPPSSRPTTRTGAPMGQASLQGGGAATGSNACVPSRCFVLVSMYNKLFVFATSTNTAAGDAYRDDPRYASVESAFVSFPNRWSAVPSPSSSSGPTTTGKTRTRGAAGFAPLSRPSGPVTPSMGARSSPQPTPLLPDVPQTLDNYITLDPQQLQDVNAAGPAVSTHAWASLKGKVYLVVPEELQDPQDVASAVAPPKRPAGSGATKGRQPLAWNHPDGVTTELPAVFYWQYGSVCLVHGILLHGSLHVLEKARAMLRRQEAARDPWVDRLLSMASSRFRDRDGRAGDAAGEQEASAMADAAGITDSPTPFDMALLPIGVLSVIHMPDRLQSLQSLIQAAGSAKVSNTRSTASTPSRAHGSADVMSSVAPVMFKRARVPSQRRQRSQKHQRARGSKRGTSRRPTSSSVVPPSALLLTPALARGEITSEMLDMIALLKRRYRQTRRWVWTERSQGAHVLFQNLRHSSFLPTSIGGHAGPMAGHGVPWPTNPAATEERLLSFSASYDHFILTTNCGLYIFAHLAAAPLPGSRRRGLSGALPWKNMLLYTRHFTSPNAAGSVTAGTTNRLLVCRDVGYPSLFFLANAGVASAADAGAHAFPEGTEEMTRLEMTRTHTHRGFAVAQLLALADRICEEEVLQQQQQQQRRGRHGERNTDGGVRRRSYDPHVHMTRGASHFFGASASRTRRSNSEGGSARSASDWHASLTGGGLGSRQRSGVAGTSVTGPPGSSQSARATTVHVQPWQSSHGRKAAAADRGHGSHTTRKGSHARAGRGAEADDDDDDLSTSSGTRWSSSSYSSSRSASSSSFSNADREMDQHQDPLRGTGSVAASSSHASSTSSAARAHVLHSRWHALTAAKTAQAGLASAGEHAASAQGPLGPRAVTTASFAGGNTSFSAASFVGARQGSSQPLVSPSSPQPVANASFFGSPTGDRNTTRSANRGVNGDPLENASFFPNQKAATLSGASFSAPLDQPHQDEEGVTGQRMHWSQRRSSYRLLPSSDSVDMQREYIEEGLPVRSQLGFHVVGASAREERFNHFLDTNPILFGLLDHAVAPRASTTTTSHITAQDPLHTQSPGQPTSTNASVQALVIPNIGVAPGTLHIPFVNAPSSASSLSVAGTSVSVAWSPIEGASSDQMAPTTAAAAAMATPAVASPAWWHGGHLYYQPDHLYEMALRLAASLLPSRYADAQALLDATRHAYGSFLLSRGRHLEAAVQWGRLSTGFSRNGLTSFNTALVEFARVARQSAELDPLVVLLRLRLQACERAEAIGGGGGTVGLFTDCSVEKSMLATLLLCVLLEKCNEKDILSRKKDPSGAGTENASHRLTASHNDSTAGTATDLTRVGFIRRKYHLDQPSLLLEDAMLRYRGLLTRSALRSAMDGIASAARSAYLQELLQHRMGNTQDEEEVEERLETAATDVLGGSVSGSPQMPENRAERAMRLAAEGVCMTLMVRHQSPLDGLDRLKAYRTPSAVPSFFHAGNASGTETTPPEEMQEEDEETTRPSQSHYRTGKSVSFADASPPLNSVGGSEAAAPAAGRGDVSSLAEQTLRRKPFPLYAIAPDHTHADRKGRGPHGRNARRSTVSHKGAQPDHAADITDASTARLDTTVMTENGAEHPATHRLSRQALPQAPVGITYVPKPPVVLSPAAQAWLWERFTPILLRSIPHAFVHDGLIPQMEDEVSTYGAPLIRTRRLLPSLLLYRRSWNRRASLRYEGDDGIVPLMRPPPRTQQGQQLRDRPGVSGASAARSGSDVDSFLRRASLSQSASKSCDPTKAADEEADLKHTQGDDEDDDDDDAHAPENDTVDDAALETSSAEEEGTSGSLEASSSASGVDSDGSAAKGSTASMARPSNEMVSMTFFMRLIEHAVGRKGIGSSPKATWQRRASEDTSFADPAVSLTLSSLLVKHGSDAMLQRYMAHLAAAEVAEATCFYVQHTTVLHRRASQADGQLPTSSSTALPSLRALCAFVYRISFARGRLLGCAWAEHILGHHISAQNIALKALNCPELAVLFLQRQKRRYDALQEVLRSASAAAAQGGVPGNEAGAMTLEVAAPSAPVVAGGVASGLVGATLVAEKELAKRRRLWLSLIRRVLSTPVSPSPSASPSRRSSDVQTGASWQGVRETGAEAERRHKVLAQTGETLVLDARGGPVAALQLIPVSLGDVDITDILPLLAPTTRMGRFKTSLLESLDAVSVRMSALQASIDSGGQEAAVLQRDLWRSKASRVLLSTSPMASVASGSRGVSDSSSSQQQQQQQQQQCALCRQPALSRPFVAFPRCKHTMHLSCYYARRAELLSTASGNPLLRPEREEDVTDGITVERFHMEDSADDSGAQRAAAAAVQKQTRTGTRLAHDPFTLQEVASRVGHQTPRSSPSGSFSCLLCTPLYVRLLLDAPLSFHLTSTAAEVSDSTPNGDPLASLSREKTNRKDMVRLL